jgi:prepilin-type N-terminal cleavage/methylation domain-containing protein/prepilin-type processing-associated H-X9-DG protein
VTRRTAAPEEPLMRPARPGFTLVELLAGVAALALLAGLLIPAVQRVRESANRTRCLNNLQRIGIGLLNYHDQHNALPPGRLDGPNTVGTWAAFLLPYVEEQNLYARLDIGRYNSPTYAQGNNALFVTSKRVNVYTCPSDLPTAPVRGDAASGAGEVNITAHNYGANFGNTNAVQMPAGIVIGGVTTKFLGAPFYRTTLSPAATVTPKVARLGLDVPDGTASTLLVSELVQGQPYSAPGCVRSAGGGGCFDYRGVVWWGTGTFFSGFIGPNSPAGDQFAGQGNCDSLHNNRLNPPCTTPTTSNGGTIMGSRSRHSGGVQSAFCDGSARFIRNGILINTWSALSTAQGDEAIDGSSY